MIAIIESEPELERDAESLAASFGGDTNAEALAMRIEDYNTFVEDLTREIEQLGEKQTSPPMQEPASLRQCKLCLWIRNRWLRLEHVDGLIHRLGKDECGAESLTIILKFHGIHQTRTSNFKSYICNADCTIIFKEENLTYQ